ncbi:MAG: MATE family efflux transporter [Verrucomicrobiia bacterium]
MLRPLARELPATIGLALPMIAGQLAQMLMGVIDTAMVGHLGTVPLAACAFANSVALAPFLFGMGFLSAVTVLVAHEHGAGSVTGVGESLRAGLAVASIVGLLLVALAWGGQYGLPYLGQPPEVAEEAREYFLLLVLSFPPSFVALTGKNFSEALNHPWPVFWLTMAGVGANVLLNWVFIYGNLGAPRMELEGAGVATLLARLFTAAIVLVYLFRGPRFSAFHGASWRDALGVARLRRLFQLGFPAGSQVLAEASAFSLAGIMIGWLGAVPMAAHQVALSCVGTAFMIPLGISMALSVRLGTLSGSGDRTRLRPTTVGAWSICLASALATMMIFLFAGSTLAGWFIAEKEVIELAVGIFVVAGLFQIADALQVTSVGGLRGLHDVRFTAVYSFVFYWGLGLPLAGMLAFGFELGPFGVWIGLALALGLAAVVFSVRLWCLQETRPKG